MLHAARDVWKARIYEVGWLLARDTGIHLPAILIVGAGGEPEWVAANLPAANLRPCQVIAG